jgi:light-harvesting complex I chlorophyll a/b binding protein 1
MSAFIAAKPTFFAPAAARRAVAAKAVASNATQSEAEIRDYVMTMPGRGPTPEGNVFDPINMISKCRNINEMKRWRESELIHSRVAMLAALGFVVGEQLEDFPAFLNFDGGIAGVPAIYQFQAVELTRPWFWETLVVAIGLVESFRVATSWAPPNSTGFNNLKDDYTPGDLGFDPLGLKPDDEEELKELQTKELNNGRLAMIGIAGFVAQELVVKREIFEHLLYYLEDDIIADVIDPVEQSLRNGGVDVPITPLVPIPDVPVTIPSNVNL